MKSKPLVYGVLVLTIAIVGIIFISGFIKQEEQPTIPANMTYQGTTYVNCHINPNYPFRTDKELTTISGVVKEETGSRMFPWRAAVVDGKYLFNPETGDMIYNYDELIEKFVTVNGYPGTGRIIMSAPFKPDESETITFDNAFYVCEIVGWKNIYCNVIDSDTGVVTGTNIPFWFEK